MERHHSIDWPAIFYYSCCFADVVLVVIPSMYFTTSLEGVQDALTSQCLIGEVWGMVECSSIVANRHQHRESREPGDTCTVSAAL